MSEPQKHYYGLPEARCPTPECGEILGYGTMCDNLSHSGPVRWVSYWCDKCKWHSKNYEVTGLPVTPAYAEAQYQNGNAEITKMREEIRRLRGALEDIQEPPDSIPEHNSGENFNEQIFDLKDKPRELYRYMIGQRAREAVK